jgi:hypothetical protein
MNVFDQTTGQDNADQTNQDTNQDWVAKIVSEKGDNWGDPQTLAKGYASAQEYIRQLEQQTKELREDVGKQDYVKELLEQMRKGEPPVKDTEASHSQDGTNAQGQTSLEASDIESLVEETLTKREKELTASENAKVANDKLVAVYGTEAGNKVKERSKELGMSLDSLKALAEQSPTAFLRLIGEEATKETGTVVKGTVNTSAGFVNQSGKRNFDYYQEMRRKDSRTYYSPKTQQQMMEDRLALGEKFYN